MSGYSIATNGNVPSNVPITFQTNSGNAVSASNILSVLGSGGTSTSGSGNTITITSVSSQLTWTDKSTTFTAAANNGYFCSGALTVNLPAMPSQGNTVSVICETGSTVTIQAASNQYIAIGAETSSLTGYAQSTAQGDNLILVYRNSTSTWWALEADATWLLF